MGDFSELRRGWRVLLASSMGVAWGASPVPIYAIGVFAVPLTEAYGWGRGDVMLATLPMTIAMILVVTYVGALADRIGVRPVVLASLTAFGIAFGALALTPDSLPVFYAMWFLMGMVGAGSTPVGWTRGVVAWFHRNRGLALALTLMGTGLTASFLPRYASWAIETFGWQLGFVAVALLPLGIALPLAILLFRAPPKAAEAMAPAAAPGQAATAPVAADTIGMTLGEAARDYRFWVLAFVVLLVTLQTGGTITNLVPLLQDRGYSAAQAAGFAGTIGISIIIGRVMTGYLIDRFWAPGIAFPLLAMPAVACILLIQPEVTPAMAIAAGAMIGLAAGAETDLIAFMTARYFGLKNYGRIYGVQYAVFGFAGGTSPFLFGRAFDITGSYDLVLWVSAVMVVVAACLLLTMGRYPPRFATTHH